MKAQTTQTLWSPSSDIETLKQRHQLMRKIRDFFEQRGFLEVETPLLSTSSVTDPYIESFASDYHDHVSSSKAKTVYLQTSPEYAMKRLLCAGGDSLFQICKAFRNGEAGQNHNPEFTMLEWYHLDFDHMDLMIEVDAFLQAILNTEKAEKISYQKLFEKFVNLNPHDCNITDTNEILHQFKVSLHNQIDDVDTGLQLILSHIIEPKIGLIKPIMVYDFPASQAALARIREDDYAVAERFEVYYKGIELANGFHELAHAKQQKTRFEKDNKKRLDMNLTDMSIDENFIAALNHGLPACAGVALGIDRLMMLALNKNSIQEVITFDWQRI